MDVEEPTTPLKPKPKANPTTQSTAPKLTKLQPLRRSKRIKAILQNKGSAAMASEEHEEEFIKPEDLDYSLLWDYFDLDTTEPYTDLGHYQIALDHDKEPLWHTMPAGLEALSYAPHSYASSKSKNDPDTLTWEQAMVHPLKEQLIEAAMKEIQELEEHGTWTEIPKSKATDQIIPTTWVFRLKKRPDGSLKRVKGRLAIRGNLEKNKNKINEVGIEESCSSPVVFWSTVRTFMVIAIILGWETISIDCLNAFVQATIDRPTFIQIPRGFRTKANDNETCLSLNKVRASMVSPVLPNYSMISPLEYSSKSDSSSPFRTPAYSSVMD